MGEGVYAIAGGKGGVGKTTTAINLGVVLGQAGYEVVVVDADLAMPDVGRQLSLSHERGLHGVLAEETPVREAVVDGPAGLAVLPGEDDLAAFGNANPERLRKVLKLLRIAYDVVLVDTAPGLQNEAVITYQEVDGVVLVTTPEDNAVADVEKTGQLAADVGADRLGAVVTHGEGRRARRAAGRLADDLLAVVPHHSTGGPISAASPDGAAAEAYRTVAAALPAVDASAVAPEDATVSKRGSKVQSERETEGEAARAAVADSERQRVDADADDAASSDTVATDGDETVDDGEADSTGAAADDGEADTVSESEEEAGSRAPPAAEIPRAMDGETDAESSDDDPEGVGDAEAAEREVLDLESSGSAE